MGRETNSERRIGTLNVSDKVQFVGVFSQRLVIVTTRHLARFSTNDS